MNSGRLRGDGDDQEGQVRNFGDSGIRGQAEFIAGLFRVAARDFIPSVRRWHTD
jgi:hypothetical protein